VIQKGIMQQAFYLLGDDAWLCSCGEGRSWRHLKAAHDNVQAQEGVLKHGETKEETKKRI
jgi:hypothetical protein